MYPLETLHQHSNCFFHHNIIPHRGLSSIFSISFSSASNQVLRPEVCFDSWTQFSFFMYKPENEIPTKRPLHAWSLCFSLLPRGCVLVYSDTSRYHGSIYLQWKLIYELNGGKPLKPSQVTVGVVSVTLMKILFHPHGVYCGKHGRYSVESGTRQVTQPAGQKGNKTRTGSFKCFECRELSGCSLSRPSSFAVRGVCVRESVSEVTLARARWFAPCPSEC